MRQKMLCRDKGHETLRAKNVTSWWDRFQNLWTLARNRALGVPDGLTQVTVTVARGADDAFIKFVRNVPDEDVASMLEAMRDDR